MLQKERIIEIADEKYHYSSGYYTVNKWLDDENIVVARSKNQTIGASSNPKEDNVQLVIYNVFSGKNEVLCDDLIAYQEYAVYEKTIYYSNGEELKSINTKTGEIKTIHKRGGMICPHLTNDGKVLSVYIENDVSGLYTFEAREAVKPRPVVFMTINLETGEAKELFEAEFEKPLSWAAHGMICPTNPNLMFFCHEGDTFYVSNRLWLYDDVTKKKWNIAKQRLDEDGNLGDCYGHEMWAPDGKGLYFVKYPCSPTPPRGICYVDVQTGKAELLYSGYRYWHVGVSTDGNYLTADTQTGKDYSEVVVIDKKDNTEIVIDTPKTNWIHPCHPHPQLSPDNKKLVYTALNEKGRTCVKVALLK